MTIEDVKKRYLLKIQELLNIEVNDPEIVKVKVEDNKTEEAYKETEGKLFYELDWSFITQMAERMASNKKEGKYELWNWKKPMSTEKLKQATMRHLLEVMDGNYEDDGRKFGHLEAISNNVMMINYQLKQYKNNEVK
jgi:hypothetical protein